MGPAELTSCEAVHEWTPAPTPTSTTPRVRGKVLGKTESGPCKRGRYWSWGATHGARPHSPRLSVSCACAARGARRRTSSEST